MPRYRYAFLALFLALGTSCARHPSLAKTFDIFIEAAAAGNTQVYQKVFSDDLIKESTRMTGYYTAWYRQLGQFKWQPGTPRFGTITAYLDLSSTENPYTQRTGLPLDLRVTFTNKGENQEWRICDFYFPPGPGNDLFIHDTESLKQKSHYRGWSAGPVKSGPPAAT